MHPAIVVSAGDQAGLSVSPAASLSLLSGLVIVESLGWFLDKLQQRPFALCFFPQKHCRRTTLRNLAFPHPISKLCGVAGCFASVVLLKQPKPCQRVMRLPEDTISPTRPFLLNIWKPQLPPVQFVRTRRVWEGLCVGGEGRREKGVMGKGKESKGKKVGKGDMVWKKWVDQTFRAI